MPYEILEAEIFHLIGKSIGVADHNRYYYWDMAHAILEKFGWTETSFDKECLRRIDLYWNLLLEGKVVPIRSDIKISL